MAKERREIEVPDWLGTYSDTVTLLLTFFVLLYSLSSVDSEKSKAVSQALNTVMTGQAADSMLEFDKYKGKVPLVGGESEDVAVEDSEGKGVKTYEDLQQYINANNLSDQVSITQNERGVMIQLKDTVLFEKGSADIKLDAQNVLDTINNIISTMPNSIIVEGHTDNDPISTFEFQSNWELSSARASRVVRYFIEIKGQDPSRFSAAAYGDTRPIYPNVSEENKTKNRRVNILIAGDSKEGVNDGR